MTKTFCDRCDNEAKHVVQVRIPGGRINKSELVIDLCGHCLRYVRRECAPVLKCAEARAK